MVEDIAVGATEVVLVPAKQARQPELVAFDADAARVVDVGHRRLAQLPLELIGLERLRLQVGTADGAAGERIVDPRIAPDRAQDAVRDVVQRQRDALDLDQLLAPRARSWSRSRASRCRCTTSRTASCARSGAIRGSTMRSPAAPSAVPTCSRSRSRPI